MEVNTKEIRKLENKFLGFRKASFPTAVKNTLNAMAFRTRKVARKELSANFVLRNTFTKQSMRVTQATGGPLDRMRSISYSIAPYLLRQEEGGVKRFPSGRTVPLLTSYGSGEGRGKRPRRRLSRPTNKLNKIKVHRYENQGKTQPQRNMIQINQAIRRGQGRAVYLKYGTRKGIYRVYGSRRNIRTELIWDVTGKSYRIPRKPFWEQSVKAGTDSGAYFYKTMLKREIKRAGNL